MRNKLLLVVIGLFLDSLLFAQSHQLINSDRALFDRLKILSHQGIISERNVMQVFANLGYHQISPADATIIANLLQSEDTEKRLQEELLRLEGQNLRYKLKADTSLLNSVPITKANDQLLTAMDHATIMQVLEDFQVNDDTSSNVNQDFPAIAVDKAGNFVVV